MMPQLLAAIIDQLTVNPQGVHGLSHWARVLDNGQRLAEQTGANRQVVEYFALFHDSRRLSEDADPQHGQRGAALAEQLHRDGLLGLEKQSLQLLLTACRLHTVARTHEEVTVRTCFDADRLDLARIGKTINPDYLCTEAAKNPATIAWATKRSTTGFIPENFLGQALLALQARPE